MPAKILKPASTNIMEIPDVFDEVSGVFLTSVNATATEGALLDSALGALSPAVALTWTYVAATSGTWRTTLVNSVALVDGTDYFARVKFTVTSTGVVRMVYIPCRARLGDG